MTTGTHHNDVMVKRAVPDDSEYVGFAGKLTDVLNPKRPAAQDRSESTLMDDIWAGAPFKDRAAFIKKVQEVTKTYQDEGLLSSRDRQVVLLASARAKMS